MVQFYSDPNLSPDLTGFTNDGVGCTEVADPGCNSATFGLTLTDGTIMTITGASDGEAVFDPFGFGGDTSDQIKFACSTNCQLVNNVPEPGSVSLLLTMLVAGGFGAGLLSKASRKSRLAVG